MTARLLLTCDCVGGVWQYSLELARDVASRGVEVLLANLGPAPGADQRQQAAAAGARLVDTGLPLDWLADTPDDVRRAAEGIAELAEWWRADGAQLHSPALATASLAIPVVAVVHSCPATWWDRVRGTPLPPDFAWRTALVERGLHAADRVVAPTAAFATMVQRRYRLPTMPLAVHNGRSPRSAGRGERRDFVMTAGRLWDEGKDVATLDRAAALLSVPLRAAGPVDGPNGARISLTHATAFGVLPEPELARLLGHRPVFVSAARYEPFGLAVLEAAMAGCALVLADIASFRELWSDAALFVEPGDHHGFAAAVQALIDHPDERSRLGMAAEARSRCYTPERLGAAMLAIHRQLAGAGLVAA